MRLHIVLFSWTSFAAFAQAESEAPFTSPPITGPPITLPPVTAAPIDTTPSASPVEHPMKSDYRCGVDAVDAKDNCGNICEGGQDCAPGTFCFGTWNKCYAEESPIMVAPSSPLPPQLQPKSDFRCGVTEVDARSNCKPECTVSTDCPFGESCWGTHINYCHMMPEGHPQCDHTEAENVERRCGRDEMAARGFCAPSCTNEVDCYGTPGDKCFPVHLNLCGCFERQDIVDQVIPQYRHRRSLEQRTLKKRYLEGIKEFTVVEETNEEYFERAEEPLNSYFQETDDSEDRAKNINSIGLEAQGTDAQGTAPTTSAAFKHQYIGPLLLCSAIIVATFL